MTTCVAKKFACYLRNTRANSALEYVVLVGIAVVVIFVVHEIFLDDLRKAVTALGRQLSGTN